MRPLPGQLLHATPAPPLGAGPRPAAGPMRCVLGDAALLAGPVAPSRRAALTGDGAEHAVACFAPAFGRRGEVAVALAGPPHPDPVLRLLAMLLPQLRREGAVLVLARVCEGQEPLARSLPQGALSDGFLELPLPALARWAAAPSR